MTESMLEPMVFDMLTPARVPVTINGQEYVLYEATEGDVCQWRNHQLRSTQMQDGKVKNLDGMADSEPLLVSLCLRKVVNNQHLPVPINVVRQWQHKMVDTLFERAKLISGLVDEESEEAISKQIDKLTKRLDRVREKHPKNLPSPTADTSDSPKS